MHRGYWLGLSVGLVAMVFLARTAMFSGAVAQQSANAQESRSEDGQTTLVLAPVADAQVSSARPATNFGGSMQLEAAVAASESDRSLCLVRFNLLAYLPAGAVIESARLELNLRSGSNGGTVNLTVCKVVSDWMEYTITWNARPKIEAPCSEATVGTALMYYRWDVTEAARAWLSGPDFGLAVSGPERTSDYSRRFASREQPTFAPRLVVTYRSTR